MKWFRMYHEFFNDVKLKSFTAAQMFAVSALLNQASQSSVRGTVLADEDDLAAECRITLDELKLVIAKLKAKGIIERLDGGGFRFLAWEVRQPTSDADPTKADRQKRFRQKKAAENQADTETVTRYSSVSNGPVTGIDKIREEEKRIDTNSSLRSELDSKQKKPKAETYFDWLHSAELVAAENLGPPAFVEAQRQTACDWLAATGKRYKDYKAFFRNWLRRAHDTASKPKAPNNSRNHSTADELAAAANRFGLRTDPPA